MFFICRALPLTKYTPCSTPSSFADALRAVGKVPFGIGIKEPKELHSINYSFLSITKYILFYIFKKDKVRTLTFYLIINFLVVKFLTH